MMGFHLHKFMNFANPALRTLIPTISAAYAFQIAVSIPSVILQEDRFYGIFRFIYIVNEKIFRVH